MDEKTNQTNELQTNEQVKEQMNERTSDKRIMNKYM